MYKRQEQSLRSLTSLAMHVVSAITITDDIEQWPMVNEVLKALRHGGIVISGTGGRDALAGYLRYLSDPVSYTHLDVYKRQTSSTASTTASSPTVFCICRMTRCTWCGT